MAAIAIVGAGMAGLAAAHVLNTAGHQVALFDKGRSLGGRIATRTLTPHVTMDHGAQYFTARDPIFAAAVAEWASKGVVAPWGEAHWWVGVPAMTAPAHLLVGSIPIATGYTVARLTQHATGWQLTDMVGVAHRELFEAVLLTAPAPQARALISTANVDWPEAIALERVRYAPCWALMIAHVGQPVFTTSYVRHPAEAIAWMARNSTKPGRSDPGSRVHETLVVHATPEWSRENLECEPNEVVRLLMDEVRRALGQAALADVQTTHLAAHRWRYALVEEAIGEPCLWSPTLRLGVAGDGCLSGRVEAAYLSGRALADRVRETCP